jgi:hypothetical protein
MAEALSLVLALGDFPTWLAPGLRNPSTRREELEQ